MDELRGGRVLEQEAAGTRAQRLVDVAVEIEGGEHEHTWFGLICPAAEDLSGGLQTVQNRHAHIHQNHVRPQIPGQTHRLCSVGSLPDDGDVGLRVQQRTEPFPHHGLIVGDEAGGAHSAGGAIGLWRGKRATTANPPSGPGPTVSDPPSRATRSCIPNRP